MPTLHDLSELINRIPTRWALMQIDAKLDYRFSEKVAWRRHDPYDALTHMFSSGDRALRGMKSIFDVPLPPDVVIADDPELPACWPELHPPCHGFWFRGSRALLEHSRVRVAVIGSRHPRPDALEAARGIAALLARVGITVVSGLAIGIDGSAHEAALQAGGSTIGVLPADVNMPYPTGNRELAESIASSPCGLLISEYPPGSVPMRHRFVERNRLIAGLADYVVVVQAASNSGSMSTVKVATDLGIPIGVVPSALGDIEFTGSLDLIRDGVDCVVDGISVLNALARHHIISANAVRAVSEHSLSSILAIARTEDEVAALSGLTLGAARVLLVELEACQLVRRLADGRWIDMATIGTVGSPNGTGE